MVLISDASWQGDISSGTANEMFLDSDGPQIEATHAQWLIWAWGQILLLTLTIDRGWGGLCETSTDRVA